MSTSILGTYLQLGDFDSALDVIQNWSYIELREILLEYCGNDKKIAAYVLLCERIALYDDWHMHILAAELLVSMRNHLDGANATARYHMQQALLRKPADVDLHRITMFAEIADIPFSEEESQRHIQQVLSHLPNNELAKSGYLESGDFQAVFNLVQEWDITRFKTALLDYAYDTHSIATFALCREYMTSNHEQNAQECIISLPDLLCVEDEYATAYYYTKRAIRKFPQDAELLRSLVFFYHIPEKLVTKEEAIAILEEVLRLDPGNERAQKEYEELRNK